MALQYYAMVRYYLMGSKSEAQNIRYKIHTVLKIKATLGYVLFALALLWCYCEQPKSGHVQELEKQRKFYLNHIDSVSKAYDKLLLEKDSAAFQLFKHTQAAASRAESEAIIWKQKYNEAKKHKTGIVSNRAYDSLLNILYPGQP